MLPCGNKGRVDIQKADKKCMDTEIEFGKKGWVH